MNWVLLRGLGRNHYHWGDFPKKLAKRPEVGEVYCPDLPGFGDLNDSTAPLTIAETMTFVRDRMIEKFGSRFMDQPWGILGLSLGGMVTLEWISQFPKDFRKAVVINTSGAATSLPIHRFKGQSFLQSIVSKNLKNIVQLQSEDLILSVVSNKYSNHKTVLSKWKEIAKKHPYSYKNLVRQLLAASYYSPVMERISTPITFLCSANDRLVDCGCTLQLARRSKNSEVHVHPSAGHEMQLDDPKWVIDRSLTPL